MYGGIHDVRRVPMRGWRFLRWTAAQTVPWAVAGVAMVLLMGLWPGIFCLLIAGLLSFAFRNV